MNWSSPNISMFALNSNLELSWKTSSNAFNSLAVIESTPGAFPFFNLFIACLTSPKVFRIERRKSRDTIVDSVEFFVVLVSSWPILSDIALVSASAGKLCWSWRSMASINDWTLSEKAFLSSIGIYVFGGALDRSEWVYVWEGVGYDVVFANVDTILISPYFHDMIGLRDDTVTPWLVQVYLNAVIWLVHRSDRRIRVRLLHQSDRHINWKVCFCFFWN